MVRSGVATGTTRFHWSNADLEAEEMRHHTSIAYPQGRVHTYQTHGTAEVHLLVRRHATVGVHLLFRRYATAGVHLSLRRHATVGVHLLFRRHATVGVHLMVRRLLT